MTGNLYIHDATIISLTPIFSQNSIFERSMIYTFNMFDLKKIYLHTYDGQGIRVVLRPQRNTQAAAGMTSDQ